LREGPELRRATQTDKEVEMRHDTTSRRSLFRHSLLAASILAASVLWPASGARAAFINVDTTADEDVNGNGTCSLREAMTAAQNQAAYHECPAGTMSSDVITFSVTGTITLGSQLPTVETILEIAGPGAASLTISGNESVGIFLTEGLLILHDLTITDGRRPQGGAVYIQDGAQLSVARVVFDGNASSTDPGQGGAIFDDDGSLLSVTDSTFVGNSAPKGGAIYIGDSASSITVTNSTFVGNSALNGGGGAIANGSTGTLTIINSTFSGNSASTNGGAVALLFDNFALGQISVTNATFSGNTALSLGGAVHAAGAGVTLSSTIISGSASCSGPISDGGYNIDDGATCGFGGTSLPLTNPELDPAGPQPNGGPTNTIAISATSPALDLIPSATNGCGTTILTDQRGVAFPRPVDGDGDSVAACDVGAFEREAPVPTTTTTTTTTTSSTTTTTLVENLNVTHARFERESQPGRSNGSIKVRGDFQTPPAFTFPPAFDVRVQDGGATDVSHTYTDCRSTGGRVRCNEVAGSSRFNAYFQPSGSGYRFKVSFQRISIAGPFSAPVTVTITHNGATVRQDAIADCRQSNSGLSCHTP
jgi:CSLREA domain-containing protein